MTDIERTRATIARLEQKLASADPASRQYYELCIAGSQRWAQKLERGGLSCWRRGELHPIRGALSSPGAFPRTRRLT